MMIFDMLPGPRHGTIPGKCAKCGGAVHEALFTLDDCHNVWAGKCPHCGAINLLAMTSMRGYSSKGMDLVLPTDEEREANEELPRDCPTSGPAGVPATPGGTVAGKLYEKFRQEAEKEAD